MSVEAIWPSTQQVETSSGSGAVPLHDDFSWTNSVDVGDVLEQEMTYMVEAAHAVSGDLKPGERFNTKTAPAFNGTERWYIYEELVRDWEDITTIEVEKRGAHLRNRLTGDAVVYKPQMDKEKLKGEGGVQYFLDFLRPLHLKDASAVFLFRLVQYMRIHRGKLDFGRWCSRFDVMKLRLFEAWDDTCELVPMNADMDDYNEEARKFQQYKDLRTTDEIVTSGH